MAVIFTKQQGPDHYEVRSAGSSVRLYSNGVLHSQYNPLHPISGAIWDLLVLPGFFLKRPPRNILVLGLGGGTVVHLMRYFFPNCKITCVEREALHIKIAKRFFKLPKDVTVIHGDAYAALANLETKFDWVLDDVFQHATGEPERDVKFEDVWALYNRVLAQHAVLSMNTIGAQQLKSIKKVKGDFDHSYVLRHPLYDNAIVSMCRNGRSKAEFFEALSLHKALDSRRKTCRLQVSMRAL